MKQNRKRLPPRLAASAYGYLLVVTVLIGLAMITIMPRYSQTVADGALARSVQTRTESTALDFARALNSDWEEVQFLAQIIGTQSPDQIRGQLDGIVAAGGRVSWVGYAGLDGQVIAASGGLLEGVDVSSRPWFDAGLRRPFAGDVHEAVLLNRLLNGTETNPLRFIDFAMPVLNADDEVIGVLGTHTTFDWVERYLTESAAVRGIDVYLINTAGSVVYATGDVPDNVGGVQALRAAAMGVTTQSRETWPDGQEYFATTIPAVTYGTMPSFGWRLVGRVPGTEAASDRRLLETMLIALTVAAFAVFASYMVFFFVTFIRPLVRLVTSAEQIAAGEQVYPYESKTSAEAARLSWALSRIQSDLFKLPGKDDPKGS